jgi:hypothetical protein
MRERLLLAVDGRQQRGCRSPAPQERPLQAPTSTAAVEILLEDDELRLPPSRSRPLGPRYYAMVDGTCGT